MRPNLFITGNSSSFSLSLAASFSLHSSMIVFINSISFYFLMKSFIGTVFWFDSSLNPLTLSLRVGLVVQTAAEAAANGNAQIDSGSHGEAADSVNGPSSSRELEWWAEKKKCQWDDVSLEQLAWLHCFWEELKQKVSSVYGVVAVVTVGGFWR